MNALVNMVCQRTGLSEDRTRAAAGGMATGIASKVAGMLGKKDQP